MKYRLFLVGSSVDTASVHRQNRPESLKIGQQNLTSCDAERRNNEIMPNEAQVDYKIQEIISKISACIYVYVCSLNNKGRGKTEEQKKY